jgi:hypothetical protein
MNKRIQICNSSVGKKFLVGLTGLFLCSFLVVHFSGNMLLFMNDGEKAYNRFSPEKTGTKVPCGFIPQCTTPWEVSGWITA